VALVAPVVRKLCKKNIRTNFITIYKVQHSFEFFSLYILYFFYKVFNETNTCLSFDFGLVPKNVCSIAIFNNILRCYCFKWLEKERSMYSWNFSFPIFVPLIVICNCTKESWPRNLFHSNPQTFLHIILVEYQIVRS
jgi:hypothetical protein